ncbi:DUF5130 family protein [Haloglycomyces albus]|uniref:DUF5130 family protein n=1 Tax=Haloglycomyces albus TaxID=526067 RepID=UPI0004A2EBD3|nr:DUF5130 family protein [Haloglycomyces albus]
MASGNTEIEPAAKESTASAESGVHQALDGPFDTADLMHIDQVLTNAQQHGGGLDYSVYVGDLSDQVRETAEKLHDRLSNPDVSVLIAISPEQKQLEIVTGATARERIPDRSAALAVFSMEAELGQGKLANAVVVGLRMLADTAGST